MGDGAGKLIVLIGVCWGIIGLVTIGLLVGIGAVLGKFFL